MSKESFHVASDVFPILYNKLCICTGHLNLRQLKKVYWDSKLEHLKIVTSENQHTKTTENEEVYSELPHPFNKQWSNNNKSFDLLVSYHHFQFMFLLLIVG